MKLLIYEWDAFLEPDILEICGGEGIGYTTFSWKFADKNRDDAFEEWFYGTVDCRSYTALLSINYWPMLSAVCQKRGLKYIAWCYDNPLNVVRSIMCSFLTGYSIKNIRMRGLTRYFIFRWV